MEPVHVIRRGNADFDGDIGYHRPLIYSAIKRRRGYGQRRRRVIRLSTTWLFGSNTPLLLRKAWTHEL